MRCAESASLHAQAQTLELSRIQIVIIHDVQRQPSAKAGG
jgi:hypothetical protein